MTTKRVARILAALDQIAEGMSDFPDAIRLPVEQAFEAMEAAAALSAASVAVVATKELPDALRKALRDVGYMKQDIRLLTADHFTLQQGGGDGRKSFSCIVNLSTGQFKTEWGSWGGANAFEQTLTDNDNTRRPLPPNIAVIQGTSGGTSPTYATITVNPSTIAGMLPAPAAGGGLSPEEQKALEAIASLISSARKSEFLNEGLGASGPTNPLILSLQQKGLVKILANGGVSITTAGKNARKPRY
jgi:hypothetical protein